MNKDFKDLDEVESDLKSPSISYSVSRPIIKPKNFLICQKVLQDTITHLYNAGLEKKEAAVLWYGFYFIGGHNGANNQLNCYIQNYHPISFDEADFASVNATNMEISKFIEKVANYRKEEFSLFHVMMIHTHPGEAFHSITDDISLEKFGSGSYSIVIPDFAKKQKIFVEGMKCYYFNSEGKKEEIHDIESKFTIIKDPLEVEENINTKEESENDLEEIRGRGEK